MNWYHHKKCLNSSTQLYRPTVHLDLGWVNATQRPPVKFDSQCLHVCVSVCVCVRACVCIGCDEKDVECKCNAVVSLFIQLVLL